MVGLCTLRYRDSTLFVCRARGEGNLGPETLGGSHVEGAVGNPSSRVALILCRVQFLSRSLEQVDDEEWLMEVGNIMGDRDLVISRYSAFSEEKSFLYKCMGVMMRKSNHKQFVQKHLDMLFSTVKHTIQVEREVYSIN